MFLEWLWVREIETALWAALYAEQRGSWEAKGSTGTGTGLLIGQNSKLGATPVPCLTSEMECRMPYRDCNTLMTRRNEPVWSGTYPDIPTLWTPKCRCLTVPFIDDFFVEISAAQVTPPPPVLFFRKIFIKKLDYNFLGRILPRSGFFYEKH